MTISAFQPEILYSSPSLAYFLEGKEEVDRIRCPEKSLLASRWCDRWDVNDLSELESFYHLILGFIWMAASCLLHELYLTDLSKHLWVLSRHELSDGSIIKIKKIFHDHLLTRSINTYRKDIVDFYLHNPLSFSLREQGDTYSVEFFQERGLCRGMSHWFVYLYLKTLGHFAHAEEHIRAVGKQFEQGASRQAAFLQGLNSMWGIYELLKIRIQPDCLNILIPGKTHAQLIQIIQIVVPGVYGIYVGNHQLIYIKIHSDQQFLFDPNFGVFKVHQAAIFQEVMCRYFDKQNPSVPILIDRYFL